MTIKQNTRFDLKVLDLVSHTLKVKTICNGLWGVTSFRKEKAIVMTSDSEILKVVKLPIFSQMKEFEITITGNKKYL